MLQNVVAQAPQEEVTTRRARKSGGNVGAAIGAVAGGIIGGYMGNGNPTAIMAGSETGMKYGEKAGNAFMPGRQASSSIERRMANQTEQFGAGKASQQIKDSIIAVRGAPPEVQQEYTPILMNAYMQDYAKQKGLA